jgi:hypothetical protein
MHNVQNSLRDYPWWGGEQKYPLVPPDINPDSIHAAELMVIVTDALATCRWYLFKKVLDLSKKWTSLPLILVPPLIIPTTLLPNFILLLL